MDCGASLLYDLKFGMVGLGTPMTKYCVDGVFEAPSYSVIICCCSLKML